MSTPQQGTPLPSRLQQAVRFWTERLSPEAAALGQALSRPGLETQLAAVLRPLYLFGDLTRPELCPVKSHDHLRRALSALDEVVGVPPERVNALVLSIVEYGQRAFGWCLPAPVDVLLRLPRELPVLVEDDFIALSALTRLETGLEQAASHLSSWGGPARAGHLLHHALVLGGLLRPELITGFLSLQPQDLMVTPYGSWVTIPLATSPAERWLLRPELELILLAYWRDFPPPVTHSNRPWALLRAYYAAAGIAPALQPKSLAQCKRWARARQALRLPPLLVEVLTGGLVSSALSATAHRRFCTGEPLWQADDRVATSVTGVPAALFAPAPPHAPPLPMQEDRALKRLFRCLYETQGGRSAVRRHLEAGLRAEGPHLSLVGQAIAQWAHHLLAHETKQRKISTIRRYVQPVRRYVLPQLRHSALDSLTGEGWRAALQEAIDAANDALAPLAIYQFARFVTAQPQGPDFDVEDLEGLDSAQRVRPNLLSVTDFERAMEQLQAPSERERRMACLIGVLGFYAGLRRNEALHLRLRDLQGVHQLWLEVSNNRYRSLKSHAGQRLLPLHALVPDHWQRELRAWRSQRTHEGGAKAPEQRLFCALGKGFSALPAESLIRPVRDAIRAVSGDYSLVFHQLRHSFASWTLVRLLAAELPLPVWQQRFAAFAHAWFNAASCTALRRSILGVADERQPTRHAAYALARLLGHQRVATTLRAYIHVAGLMILGMQTQPGVLALGEGEVCALLGLDQGDAEDTAAYQRWRRLRRTAWSAQHQGLDPEPVLRAARGARRFAGADWPAPGTVQVPIAVLATPAVTYRPVRLEQIPALLGALFDQGLTIDHSAEVFQIAPLEVQRVKDAAVALAAQRTVASGKPRFILPPSAPSGQADGDAFKTILRRLDAGDLDWPTVRAGIHLLDRSDPSRGHRLLVRDEAAGCQLVAMLVALGFATTRLRVDLYPQAGAEAENRRHWSRCLGIPEAAFTLKAPLHSPRASHGAVAVGLTGARAFSRLHPPALGAEAFNPDRAKRALAWLETHAVGAGLAWQLADAQQVADLVYLWQWLGVPPEAVTVAGEGYAVKIELSHPVEAPTLARVRRRLAQAMPYHDLRIVAADPADLGEVIRVLLACGVERTLLNIDFTGQWEALVSDALRDRFVREFGLRHTQLQRKSRRDHAPKLSLTCGMARGQEQIHAWSLTYALLMVRIFCDAGLSP